MKKKAVGIGTQFFAVFSTVIVLFLAVCSYQLYSMSDLGKLQDESARRSNDTFAILEIATRLQGVYDVIGDAIINRDIAQTEIHFGRIKAQAAKDIEQVADLADTPEEKALSEEFAKHYRSYLLLFEMELLPILKGSGIQTSAELSISEDSIGRSQEEIIRELDGRIDELKRAAIAPLQKIVDALKSESREADELFDGIRRQTVLIAVMVSIVTVLFGFSIAAIMTRSLLRRLGGEPDEVADMAEMISSGDLSMTLREGSGTGVYASMKKMVVSLRQRAELASEIADGDLTARVVLVSDRDVLGLALQKMVKSLSELLGEVQTAGEQIASSASQVSDSSQTLSQGATEQASSLEEISASTNQLSSQTRMNADNATQANHLMAQARGAAETGQRQMQEMVAAMAEINGSSQNISRIIKTIDEIAFQTNLLALNAAVEAARAGQHGKGFAVVAEEVRNLAARSAKAAKETAELIDGSVKKTENGSQIANHTASALQEIVAGITKVSDLVGEIAAASNEQAEGIAQVSQGLGQIEQVTQQTTASAEESAAAAEELSSEAGKLQKMLDRFQLRDGLRAPSIPGLSEPPRIGSSWGETVRD